MSAVVASVFTGTVNDQPLRFFKAHLPGLHLPWHATEDLQRCLALPRDLRRHFQQQLRSSDWKNSVRTVATSDGIVTIAPHFIAQGLIAAMQDVGRADILTEIRYQSQAKEAWDQIYPGANFADALHLLVAAARHQGEPA
jgi:hypothetical protein